MPGLASGSPCLVTLCSQNITVCTSVNGGSVVAVTRTRLASRRRSRRVLAAKVAENTVQRQELYQLLSKSGIPCLPMTEWILGFK